VTHTCEREPSLVDGHVAPEAGQSDAALDAPSGPPVSALLGTAQSAANGTTVSLVLTKAVAAGTMLVAEVAGRGDPPVSVTDSKLNTWSTVVEVGNASGASIAGVYAVVVAAPLAAGDTITATVTSSSSYTRAIAVFALDRAATVDRTGTAQTTGTNPSVTTTGAVTATAELELGVIATGFNTADAFTPGLAFEEVFEFGTTFSSGSFNRKSATAPVGPRTFTVTTLQSSASYALAIATFR
jgi:hypothetical protein